MNKVSIRTEYILLGQFLKFVGIIANGGESKAFLEANIVKINGEKEQRRGKKLYNGDVIEVLGVQYQIISNYSVQ